ncbi:MULTISPECIES: XdhC family protein [Gordonia]|uniref:XdhC family protein n=1 Tax=Gordonia amicalis TaxID=89053 RepID=A0AAE4R1G6_9ACTN|nr:MULTISPECIES: XdhC/CoxI family protein [Gordonia]ATD69919.1 XshC-Cox1 family protein [Gordonia sp. 1D]MCZ0911982.1 XdhC family protein [Gordonia amicalis]MCZ4651893.1 XdhC family protein [Gordonia amicalis]MDV6307015.1 XdhC family protein [Gordonia amicalis]MDV6311630.1 XdhC family protein [Gordonia amicalis]
MRDILPDLLGVLGGADARPVALCRVVATAGSAPREVGAAMVVTAESAVFGSVSGGCVEGALVHTAQQVLSDGIAVVEQFGIEDPRDPAPGLTCGGQIDVVVERIEPTPERLDQLRRLADAVAAEKPIAVATTLTADPEWYLATETSQPPWRRLDRDVADMLATGRSGVIGVDDCEVTDPAAPTDDRPRTFVQTFAPAARLILVGANDFVRALSALGSTLGMRVTVVDARPVFATPERFPDADEVIVGWPDRYLAEQIRDRLIGSTTALCVMTHDTKFDVPTLRTALRSPTFGFIGALGSRRTAADRNRRLREEGVDEEQLARLRSPLGLDLGGHTPAEVAVAVAAQLIAERHGASAAPLFEGAGPIHRN